jgi:hypothetical protein
VEEAGVRTPDEAVPPAAFIEELVRRGIAVERSESAG